MGVPDVPSVLKFPMAAYGWVSSVSTGVPYVLSVLKFLVAVYG